ncbi:hypothetical protein MTO96_001446 [Rhipicephalus appendiculatus]
MGPTGHCAPDGEGNELRRDNRIELALKWTVRRLSRVDPVSVAPAISGGQGGHARAASGAVRGVQAPVEATTSRPFVFLPIAPPGSPRAS